LTPPEEDDGADVSTFALRTGLPNFLMDAFIARFGRQGALDIAHVFNGPSRRTLRVNTHLISRDQAVSALLGDATPGTLSPWALDVVSQERAQGLIAEGKAAYQDEAAQTALIALAPRPHDKVLDACAGRGGKSAAALSMTNNEIQLLATDVSASKLDRLSFELKKQKLVAETLVCNWTKALLAAPSGFDKVLVDAPCSGSGTLGRRPEIRKRLSASSIKELIEVQRVILANAANVLLPGGRLVFVVCSLLLEEGFAHAEPFLAEHPDFALVKDPPANWPEEIPWNSGLILINPATHHTDGYQMLVLEKSAGG
jgi:16S rRNA (cytosine967-C5)-methyltransferase